MRRGGLTASSPSLTILILLNPSDLSQSRFVSVPNLKQQTQAVSSELQALEMAKLDDAKYLTLAHNLSGFRQRLRARAQTLEVKERQHIVRLLVKEILVGPDTLTIRQSIPIAPSEEPPPGRDSSFFRQLDHFLRPKGKHTWNNVAN